MSYQANPKAYHTVTPYLIVRDVPRLLKFLAEAFGAVERIRVPRPGAQKGAWPPFCFSYWLYSPAFNQSIIWAA